MMKYYVKQDTECTEDCEFCYCKECDLNGDNDD